AETIAANAARLCAADDAHIFRVDGDTVRRIVRFGVLPTSPAADAYPLRRDLLMGRVILEARTLHFDDIQALLDTEFPGSKAAFTFSGARTVLAVPLVRDGAGIGGILIRRMEVRRFTDGQVRLLQTFADQAVIAIENVRLFTELQQKNEALTQAHAQVSEALEQQTATADILRVISGSLTDIQPVLDAVARSAARLCEAYDALIGL